MIEFSADPHWGLSAVAALGIQEPAAWSGDLLRVRTRPGEVVLVLRTSDRAFWVQTKHFYPPGIYRLPTGGLKESELPDDGYRRELGEEASISPAPAPQRIGRIAYRREGGGIERFVSYLYRVDDVNELPRSADAGEGISDWRKVSYRGIAEIVATLRSLPQEWNSWGTFRALAHEVLLEALDRGRR